MIKWIGFLDIFFSLTMVCDVTSVTFRSIASGWLGVLCAVLSKFTYLSFI